MDARSKGEGQGADLEILYWVTQRQDKNPPKFHSTTAKIYLRDEASTRALMLAQGVENDYATLDLEMRF